MHLTLIPDGGGPSQIWREHQLDSPFSDKQLDTYGRGLGLRRAMGNDVQLLVIVSSTQEQPSLLKTGPCVLKCVSLCL